ncbi:MAG: S8 family serine peptidase [Anaerolineae bacterium]|nr:S8 family serine peptidase [Anaerolineae bacterium]
MTELRAVEAVGYEAEDKGPATYIVQLVDAPLALYTGGVPGLSATNPAAVGQVKLDVNSPASTAYRNYLATKRSSAISLASKSLGRSLEIKYEYEAGLNGFAAEMTAQEAAQLAQLPEVWRVEKEQMQYIQTDAGPTWVGAPGIWDGTSTGGLPGTKGEGIIVGVIDTGIDPWNPSFADIGGDGYDHTNPNGAGNYLGVCDSANTSPPAGEVAYDSTFPCNDKLIGVWGYTDADANPRDADGHGSHTSSTAAGNVTYNTTITMPNGLAFHNDISGVAPHANIIMYDACADTGGCPGAALAAARDQAILDGVDVINYSIGGAYWPDPWTNVDALSWLSIREAGIFAATSAGNDGPAPGTLGSPAAFPWVTSVGNLTHNRAYVNTLVLTNSNPLSESIVITGLGMTDGMAQIADVVYSIDFANPPTIAVEDARLCGSGDPDFPVNPFPPGTFNGEIVVCERGIYARVDKSRFVFESGAGGFVLAQPAAAGGGPGARVADPHVLPGLHIDYDSYQALKTAVTNGYDMGIIPGSQRVLDDSYADIMAAGSSRGPNGSVPDLIVPSVAAPGSSIWAAYHVGATDGEYTYNMIGGTSMASPHVAGSFALLKSLQPTWSPAEAQSAVMLTADTTVLEDDAVTPASPFATGNGRLDVGRAAKSGLVMDITIDEYKAADPAAGGDPKALNTPSMGNSQCVGTCTWQRTVKSTLAYTVTWTASTDPAAGTVITATPAQFTLGPGEEQVIDVELDVRSLTAADWVFGSVILTPNSANTVPAHMPVGAVPVQYIVPDDQFVLTKRDAGSEMITDLLSKDAIPNLTGTMYGIQLPDLNYLSLDEHAVPTNDFPEIFFTDVDNVGVVTLTVPSGAARVVAEILGTTSPDLDMLLLYDEDGDGMPEFSDTLNDNYCQSAAGGPYEYCSILSPPAGTWWVLIINFAAGTPGIPDPIMLGTAVLTADQGNLSLGGTTTIAQGVPYTATILFDEMMEPGDLWYGAVGLSTDTGEDPFGMFAFDVYRLPDDVVKEGPVGALVGETVMYTVTVDTNDIHDQPLTYMITDTLPAGMTLVPGSASANFGSVSEVGSDTVLWTGTMLVPEPVYLVTDNTTDPYCDTFFGGYTDLEGFAFEPDSGVYGDSYAWAYGTLGAGTEFYGSAINYPVFFSDGFVLMSDQVFGATPWVNQNIPDPTAPNGLLAPFWRDMVIDYSPPPTNTGVTAVGLTGGVGWLVEFDDVYPYGDATQTFDYEVMAWTEADPSQGTPDIMYAFDNVNLTTNTGTIGIENATGDAATQYAYNDFIPTDGLVVCLDWVIPGDPAVITYEAVIDKSVTADSLTNTVDQVTDMVGSKVETTDYTTGIYTAKADWMKTVDVDGMSYDYTDSPITVYEGQMVTVVDTVNVTSTEQVSFTLTSMSDGFLEEQSAVVNAGTLTGSPGSYVWMVPAASGQVDTDYVFTTTFMVDESAVLEAMVEETFVLQRGVPEDDRDIKFVVPVRVDKVAPSIISKDRTMNYGLMISSLYMLDAFTVTDTIPAGVSYAGNLVESDGSARYDSGSDTVIWQSPENVIEDPSFELLTGWSEGGSIAGPTCSLAWCGADLALSGDYYLWFGGWGTTNMSYILQDVTIPASDEATLTFWMVISAPDVIDQIHLDVTIDGMPVVSFSESDAADYADYTLVTVDVSAFADGGSHLLMFQVWEVGNTLSSIYIDDVSLVAGTPLNAKDITASFDVLVEGDVGTSVTNVADFEFAFKTLQATTVTDIMSIFYMPRITRGYPNQP